MKQAIFNIPLESDSVFRLKYGLKSKMIKSVFSVEGSCWVTCVEKTNYAEALNWIETNMRKRLTHFLKNNDWLEYKTIFDFGITPNAMTVGRSKFFNFSIFFKMKEERKITSIKSKIEFEIIPIVRKMERDFKECGFQLSE